MMKILMRSGVFGLVLSVAVVAVVVSTSRPRVHETLTRPAGHGEHVLLVVADVVAPSEAAARLAELNAAFGELQGLYADTSDAYTISGARLRTSPDEVNASCADHPEYECPDRASSVRVYRDVKSRFVERTGFRRHGFPERCGSVGTPPCERTRFVELFGDDLRMPRGRVVIGTGFRTPKGADRFIAFARTVGVRGLVVVQVRKSGGSDIGLGQEAHPDGSGPLERQLPDQARRQRA
jgi:hypothetical protein